MDRMKLNKILLLFSVISLGLFNALLMAAAPHNMERPVGASGTESCISISTSAFTAAPSTTTVLAGRSGFFITSRSTNTARIGGVIDDNTLPTTVTAIQPVILQAGETQFFRFDETVFLWLLSFATSAEDVCYDEVDQK